MDAVKEKLVRDKIPELIKKEGRKPIFRVAEDSEFPLLLKKKLIEETGEFVKEPNVDELSDILEVVMALAGSMGIAWEELEAYGNKKRKEKGGFAEGFVLKEQQ
jgi:predicted house-cleaning noncanonical NTP pyrophosphatase (MazG superfamily)